MKRRLALASSWLVMSLALIPEQPRAARVSDSSTPGWADLEPGPFAIGFEATRIYDPTRICPLQPDSSGQTGRPIQLCVWYPAAAPSGEGRVSLGEYLLLRDWERSPSTWDEARRSSELEDYRKRVARSYAPDRASAYVDAPTRALWNAKAASGSFPLIVFSPSMIASTMTNTVLCEFLASHGYIVAAHPSYGPSSRLMTTGDLGLETQARDIEFVVGAMRGRANVDQRSIGLVGHSWGALASLLVAARYPDIRAVVSLDGSEEEWQEVLKRAPHYRAMGMTTPYMRATTETAYFDERGQYGFFDSLAGIAKVRLTVLGLGFGHFDFVSQNHVRSVLTQSTDAAQKAGLYARINESVRSFLDAFVKQKAEARASLVEEAKSKDDALAIEVHLPEAEAPAEHEFLRVLLEEGGEILFERYDPLEFSERVLLRRAELPLWSGRHAAEVRDLLFAVLELNPESARAYELIGVSYWLEGDKAKAEELFLTSLELDPTNRRVEGYLVTVSDRD